MERREEKRREEKRREEKRREEKRREEKRRAPQLKWTCVVKTRLIKWIFNSQNNSLEVNFQLTMWEWALWSDIEISKVKLSVADWEWKLRDTWSVFLIFVNPLTSTAGAARRSEGRGWKNFQVHKNIRTWSKTRKFTSKPVRFCKVSDKSWYKSQKEYGLSLKGGSYRPLPRFLRTSIFWITSQQISMLL